MGALGALTTLPPLSLGLSTNGYRPSSWSLPAVITLAVPPSPPSNVVGSSSTDPSTSATVNAQTYVFDAVLRLDHEQDVEKTQHPIQTGAAVNTHAYLLSGRLSLMVGMSDAMDSYASGSDSSVTPYYTQFSGSSSKSISTYQTLLQLQMARTLLTVTTRLRTYENMLIMKLHPVEDSRTLAGLRCEVELEQMLIASTGDQQGVSVRLNSTDLTNQGQSSSTPISSVLNNQFKVSSFVANATVATGTANSLLSWLTNNPAGMSNYLPGVGSYSSYAINNLSKLPVPS